MMQNSAQPAEAGGSLRRAPSIPSTKGEVWYICFYRPLTGRLNDRIYSPAASEKIDYICELLSARDNAVRLLSLSRGKGIAFRLGRRLIANDVECYELPSFGHFFRIQKLADLILLNLMVFFFLTLWVRRDATIIIAHSLSIRFAVRVARLVVARKIILQVDEIYGDFAKKGKPLSERAYLRANADAYIVATSRLNDVVNPQNRPSLVLYGSLSVQDVRHHAVPKDTTSIVYAGILDPRKSALTFLEVIPYLTNTHAFYVIGFGSSKDVKAIRDAICESNARNECKATFDGLLSGREYNSYLSRMDIGFCPQSLDAAYGDTSFPSKITSYLTRGLQVVAPPAGVITSSELASAITFAQSDDPRSYAKAIIEASKTPKPVRFVLAEVRARDRMGMARLLDSV